jgi:hypothetical protein
MSAPRRLGAVAAGLTAIASIATIIGWLFDYGHRSEHDALGLVDEWAHASASQPWVLWCGLGVALGLLTLSAFITADSGFSALFLAFAFLPMISLFSIFLPLGGMHLLSWVGYGELFGVYVSAILAGGLIGLLFYDRHRQSPYSNSPPER